MAICNRVCLLTLCVIREIDSGKRNMCEKNAECLREVPGVELQKGLALRVRRRILSPYFRIE